MNEITIEEKIEICCLKKPFFFLVRESFVGQNSLFKGTNVWTKITLETFSRYSTK